MTQVISALKARNYFGRILKAVTEKRGRFIVERRGEPSIVVMSLEDFAATILATAASNAKIAALRSQNRVQPAHTGTN